MPGPFPCSRIACKLVTGASGTRALEMERTENDRDFAMAIQGGHKNEKAFDTISFGQFWLVSSSLSPASGAFSHPCHGISGRELPQ